MKKGTKYYVLQVLDILAQYSDKEHPMLQSDIIKKLDTAEYDYTKIERKAMGRCLQDLVDCDWLSYKVEKVNNKGYYVAERPFENAELRILIDGVLSSRYMRTETAQKLVGKLIEQGDKNFSPNVSYVRTTNVVKDEKNENETEKLFETIETIDSAIAKRKKISFWYSHYNEKNELVKSTEHKDVSPYGLYVKNQRYYVMVFDGNRGRSYLRVDKIQDIEMLDEPAKDVHNMPGYKGDFNFTKEIAALPYMYSDSPQNIEFFAQGKAIDQIVDYFGESVQITKRFEDKYFVRVKTSANAMEYWALQYLNLVEIIRPVELRNKIIDDIKAGLDKYSEENK